MTTRRETLREAITLGVVGLVQHKDDELCEVEKIAVEDIIERDKKKKAQAVVQVYDKIQKLEGDLKKINRPDQVSYDKDRKPVSESYSKSRLDELEKLNKQITKFTNAIDKAINKDDWNDLYNFAGGKDPSGDDQGGGEEKAAD